MKKRFTEEQIIQILKEQEAGERTADVCRRHGISQPTFYKWKAKFGGMDVSNNYNQVRPHSALGNLSPAEFVKKLTQQKLAAWAKLMLETLRKIEWKLGLRSNHNLSEDNCLG